VDAHDQVDPVITASTIIAHVTDGVNLASKYHMPPRIKDFIREHHGTMITKYPYTRAVENANGNLDNVDLELFRYPGPKPRSKETALLMLADRCEATARAELPKDEESLRKIIKRTMMTAWQKVNWIKPISHFETSRASRNPSSKHCRTPITRGLSTLKSKRLNLLRKRAKRQMEKDLDD